ncbi:2-oxoglutarate ferredoxin oxidoreductase subunit alpha [Desulfocicer vacuolatum DSM 3385]|uniref:2-oxoglutarate ferredoxin oxidoreductase subunit alpha n=1 Tax=Desulfocicer vacuolatum DSM 3385 TaxID=1121400 RepID=A0A1W2DH39_9BACT|nr:2-oxoacid:acceptor oxidoreductase subunit alpha [Desulfocicer vacuolatum]SMC96452.1 2-oxoglutarate ferredoxin oxidoreductase subunit alpha [Desulfocicer vacuolatum DSM 3385]
MTIDITVKIGGEAGQGIQTIGTLLSQVCHGAGLFIFSVDDFESRIRGGHSFNLLRISDEPVKAPGNGLDILVALDQRTLSLNRDNLAQDAMVILNSDTDVGFKENILSIPLKGLAKEAGGAITANTVAAGAILSILGAPYKILENLLKNRFAAKGEKIINLNTTAAKKGYGAAGEIRFSKKFSWTPQDTGAVIINGSRAIAMGALASDCRFFSFYPMSPATGIMTSVVPFMDKLPIVMEQAEDEIAAVNMAIGASFAGVRSLTATSGGGFCLMTEGLGLAAISETPLVIVNAQRPGPATGLPTRTAQADLLFVLNASQDSFPRFVFAPGSPMEAFELTKKAFALSEKYQVPAIVLTDQFLNNSQVTQENTFVVDENLPTFICHDDDMTDPGQYMRYCFTQDGISPRAIPGRGKAIVRATGNEHNEAGQISEDAENKIAMSKKRNGKCKAMIQEMDLPRVLHGDSNTLLVGWGSSREIIIEACTALRQKGKDVGAVLIKEIWPLDRDRWRDILKDRTFIMVEQNSNCQMGQIISRETGLFYHGAVLKDDGRPLYPEYIIEKTTQIME